jgi:hypothetical protein
MQTPKISKHPGTTSVQKPAITESDEGKWFSYYQDQFDCYEGQVSLPSEPEEAKKGYFLAKKEWDEAVRNAHLKSIPKGALAYTGMVALAVVSMLAISVGLFMLSH